MGRAFDAIPNRVVAFTFFFQAEDGIRDLTVTGVQTCALPILTSGRSRVPRAGRRIPTSEHPRVLSHEMCAQNTSSWDLNSGGRRRKPCKLRLQSPPFEPVVPCWLFDRSLGMLNARSNRNLDDAKCSSSQVNI